MDKAHRDHMLWHAESCHRYGHYGAMWRYLFRWVSGRWSLK